MNSLINKNLKRLPQIDSFYIGVVLCMIVLSIKIFIEKG
jgi:hypothetical protein